MNIKLSNEKKKIILYSIEVLLFFVLAYIVSLKHEYWADEANAWLIAADVPIIELFTKYIRCDGHPALFHLIIKLFQSMGLTYNNFRIISLIFSTLGVAFFLFKSKFKWYIKVLLPFSYFIFYQYTVITRGYSLILLLLGLVASLWDKKKEKCVQFTISLILLLSLESYTFLIAGSIYLIYIIDYYKDYKKEKKHNKKQLICIVILFLSFLLTTLYVMPTSSNTFEAPFIMYYISSSFITPFITNIFIKILFSIVVIFILAKLILKQKNKILEVIILIVPVLLFVIFGYCNLWHCGIIMLLFIFIAWIHNYSEYNLFNLALLMVCIIQIPWSISSSLYDYRVSYSPAKEAAEFIKKYDYKNMKIYGMKYYDCAVNAYFDENIFDNWNKDLRTFYWNKNSAYYDYDYDVKTMIKENVDMIVATPVYEKIDSKELKKYYDEYVFVGASSTQNLKYENMNVYIYVRKDNQDN